MNDETHLVINDFLLELEQSHGKLPTAIMDSFIMTACRCYSTSNINASMPFIEEVLEEQYSTLANIFAVQTTTEDVELYNRVLELRPKSRCW